MEDKKQVVNPEVSGTYTVSKPSANLYQPKIDGRFLVA
jgi:hypothetical protein